MNEVRCPHCEELVRLPEPLPAADTSAQCPWCREMFSVDGVLDRLPPELVVVEDGLDQDLPVAEPENSDLNDESLEVPLSEESELGQVESSEEPVVTASDKPAPLGEFRFSNTDRPTAAVPPSFTTSALKPAKLRRSPTGRTMKMMGKMVAGGLLGVPLVIGLLALLRATGLVPNTGLPFLDRGQVASTEDPVDKSVPSVSTKTEKAQAAGVADGKLLPEENLDGNDSKEDEAAPVGEKAFNEVMDEFNSFGIGRSKQNANADGAEKKEARSISDLETHLAPSETIKRTETGDNKPKELATPTPDSQDSTGKGLVDDKAQIPEHPETRAPEITDTTAQESDVDEGSSTQASQISDGREPDADSLSIRESQSTKNNRRIDGPQPSAGGVREPNKIDQSVDKGENVENPADGAEPPRKPKLAPAKARKKPRTVTIESTKKASDDLVLNRNAEKKIKKKSISNLYIKLAKWGDRPTAAKQSTYADLFDHLRKNDQLSLIGGFGKRWFDATGRNSDGLFTTGTLQKTANGYQLRWRLENSSVPIVAHPKHLTQLADLVGKRVVLLAKIDTSLVPFRIQLRHIERLNNLNKNK